MSTGVETKTAHGQTRYCPHCGNALPAFAKSFQKFCCPDHAKKYHKMKAKLARVPVLGTDMTCGCCQETIIRTGPRQLFCNEKCEPAKDVKIKCVRCNTLKGYDDYYDNRGSFDGAKLNRACKQCLSDAGYRLRAKRQGE